MTSFKIKPYGLFGKLVHPYWDVADCAIFGLKKSCGGKNYCPSNHKKTTRRYFKRLARIEGKQIIQHELNELFFAEY